MLMCVALGIILFQLSSHNVSLEKGRVLPVL